MVRITMEDGGIIDIELNEKGRMSHCPKRFWADMVEMKDEF